MFDFSLNRDSSTPLYIQLYRYISRLIEENNIEDDKLPSIRALAKKLQVNNSTIVSAYKLLEQEDYVYSVKGSGTYIKTNPTSDIIPYLEHEDVELMSSGVLSMAKNSINFASISPTPSLFPIDEFKKSLNKVLDRDKGLAFLYPEINGYEPLRESFSEFLHDNYNLKVSKEDILITSGGQQGLDIISKTLINQGDTIFVENPTYSGAISAFNSRGANIISIPIIEDGINIEILESYIKNHNPKFLYIMTNYQSPTTYSYSKTKKEKLLELANKYNFYIIEDDFLTDLSFDNKRLPLKTKDTNNRVIFIKSFSKVFMPGIRIGFITLPNNLFKDIIKAKHTTDISSSGFLQRAFDEYLRNGYWENHIENVKKSYKEKYNLITERLDRLKVYGLEYIPPNGGLSIWVKLPENIDSIKLFEKCNENNIAIIPGKIFFTNKDIYSNFIRISFGSVDNDQIIKGMNILENILSNYFKKDLNQYFPLT